MSEREKKLLGLMVVITFVMLNLFGFRLLHAKMEAKERQTEQMLEEVSTFDSMIQGMVEAESEREWLNNNPPMVSTFGKVGGELVEVIKRAAAKGVQMTKQPQPLQQNLNEVGNYRSASCEVIVNGRDMEIYRWLLEMHEPTLARTVSSITITPAKSDDTRMDCRAVITQWFKPAGAESFDIE
ncbi:hypothetical protein [Persicirhabdus sediminis]|uniref:Type II secretion system (T2SS), protein M subtype b n=1 Tax=Persicirhabdus sediminis TaxID=454144 RepID=A0A8J7SK45_9BACT|nr:hypothetical protein [Persicirhabdus sediminis]MBK1792600.1 hypothetical protein [Persicirhabdus sediminis]